MKKRQNKGFTLIELLVVIAIIALLLAVLLPGLKKAKDVAKRVICSARLRQVGVAMKMYSDAFNGALPDDQTITGGAERHTFIVYRQDQVFLNGKLKPFRLAYLYEMNYIDTPEIFYCPGNSRSEAGNYVYENYCNPAPWGTLPQVYNTTPGVDNQWVRVGYTYFPIANNPVIDATWCAPLNLPKKYIQVNPSLPMMADLIHNLNAISHQNNNVYSLNALYSDGHVGFCNDQAVFNNLTDLGGGRDIWATLKGPGSFDMKFYYTAYYTVFRAVGTE
ncbi:MAG: prepilin-type N-terminal cleavage/methylation domain-containing protein [Planctomycetaceae bacterium]|nr:prepilin-type N-terminal cleavage/methylation domain-containing protein [Planctomycetaceae bacterium]